VEVTLSSGQRQFESEGEPVARHFGQMKKRTGKESYCLFIAPTVNPNVLAYYYVLNKTNVSYYGGNPRIIPLDLDQFMKLIDSSYNYQSHPVPRDVKQFLTDAMEQLQVSDNETDWGQRIQNCVNTWLAA
jgi:hypothetical protein